MLDYIYIGLHIKKIIGYSIVIVIINTPKGKEKIQLKRAVYILNFYTNLIYIGNKGKWPLYKTSYLNIRQVAVTCRCGTSVVRNFKFFTPFFTS